MSSTTPISDLKKSLLLADFSDQELQQLAPLFVQKTLAPGTELTKEGDDKRELIILTQGEVSTYIIDPVSGNDILLSTSEGITTLGELSFVDGEKRSATVRAISEVTFFSLSREDFDQWGQSGSALYYRFLAQLTKPVVEKLRVAKETSLAAEKRRRQFGQFAGLVFILFILQSIMTAFYSNLSEVLSIGFISIIAMIVATLICILMALTVSTSFKDFGLHTQGWPRALADGVILSLLLLSATYFLVPEALIHTISKFVLSTMGVVYIASAFLQELVFRGIFQTALQEFYEDAKGKIAIPISAITFANAHVPLGWEMVVLTFFMGAVMGWLYIRHHSLIGITLIHYTLGVIAISLGFLSW